MKTPAGRGLRLGRSGLEALKQPLAAGFQLTEEGLLVVGLVDQQRPVDGVARTQFSDLAAQLAHLGTEPLDVFLDLAKFVLNTHPLPIPPPRP